MDKSSKKSYAKVAAAAPVPDEASDPAKRQAATGAKIDAIPASSCSDDEPVPASASTAKSVAKPVKKGSSSDRLDKESPQTKTSAQNQSTASKKLRVGNLSLEVGHGEVEEFFKEAGKIVGIQIATNVDGSYKEDDPSGAFGYVEFATVEAAQKAMELNGRELFEHAIRLDFVPQSLYCNLR